MSVRQASRWCPRRSMTGSPPELARMFRAGARAVDEEARIERGALWRVCSRGFRDVLAADATVIKLHRLLARRFPRHAGQFLACGSEASLGDKRARGSGAHQGQGDGRASERPPFDADGAMGRGAVVAL